MTSFCGKFISHKWLQSNLSVLVLLSNGLKVALTELPRGIADQLSVDNLFKCEWKSIEITLDKGHYEDIDSA